MVAEGIEFQTGVQVGKDIAMQQLLDFNDAVLLCLGSTWPRDLNIPGMPILFFVSFLLSLFGSLCPAHV